MSQQSAYPLYIDGQWIDGVDQIENRSPSDTSDLIGVYAQASTDQVKDAISAARRGGREWAKSGLEQRYGVLMAVGDELMARKAELGEPAS